MLLIKNKKEFQGSWVGEVDSSAFNVSKEARIKAVTDIASICKGRLGFGENNMVDILSSTEDKGYISERRLNLYNKLLKESAGNPSTPFEFIPVKFKMRYLYTLKSKAKLTLGELQNKILKHSYWIQQTDNIITNMRTLLKAGIKEEDIPFNTPEEVEEFKCVIGKFPKNTYDSMIEHSTLSSLAESSENVEYLNKVEFHYPEYWSDDLKLEHKNKDSFIKWYYTDGNTKELKPEDATKELSCRRLILSVWSGWKQDENTWDNLFAVRAKENNAQEITGKVIDNIKELIYGK